MLRLRTIFLEWSHLVSYLCHNLASSFAWFGGSTNVSGFAQWVKLAVGIIVYFQFAMYCNRKIKSFLKLCLWTSFFFSFILFVGAFTSSYLI